eukprot:scaffold10253_cov124-Isochrysis_galbana.AAC.28
MGRSRGARRLVRSAPRGYAPATAPASAPLPPVCGAAEAAMYAGSSLGVGWAPAAGRVVA